MIGLKRFCVVVAAVASAACQANAADTVLDGSPDVFDAILLGDFNDGTSQGWGSNNVGTTVITTELSNIVVTGQPSGNTTGDPQWPLNLGNATLPGVPSQITIGSLPGQYDILQFDMRLQNLQTGTVLGQTGNTSTRGDAFLIISGSPADRNQYYVNNGTGVGGVGNGDTAPELQTDGAYHTYTMTYDSDDVAWNNTYTQVRIDPINGNGSIGTVFSLDNVRIGRSNNVQPFAAIADPVPVNLISNGDFSSLSNASTPTPVNGGYKIIGADGTPSNGVFLTDTVVVDDWNVYFEDPNGLVPLAVVGGSLEGSSYLNNRYRVNDEQPSFKSAGGYVNGMVQEDIFNGVTINPASMYEFSIDFDQRADTNQSESTFSVALTAGSGASATDPSGTTITGGLLEFTDFSQLSNDFETFTFQVSGADLLAAQTNSGQINVALELVNDATIPGLPNPAPGNVNSNGIVAQVQFDNLSLLEIFVPAAGDLNKDGLIDQSDVDLAQLYLDGDGGDLAVDRQNTLIGLGNAAPDVLASLNLSAFDLTGDDFFDQSDVDFLDAIVNPGLDGDYNGDGIVDGADYAVWRNGGSPDSSQAGFDLWRDNFGATNLAPAGASTATPEPTTMVMLISGVGIGFLRRKQS